jgi:hypothetical protein
MIVVRSQSPIGGQPAAAYSLLARSISRLRVGGVRQLLRIRHAKSPQDLFQGRLLFHDERDHGAKLKFRLPHQPGHSLI